MNQSSKILCSMLIMLCLEEYGLSVSFGYEAPTSEMKNSQAYQNNKASSGAKNNSGYFDFLRSNSKQTKNEVALKEQKAQSAQSQSTGWSLFKPKPSLKEQLNTIEIPTERDIETASQADTASIDSDNSSIVSDLSYQNERPTTPLQQAQSAKKQNIQDYKEWQSAQKQHNQQSLAPQGNKLSPKEQAQQMTRQTKNAAEQKTAARQRIQDQIKHENNMQIVEQNADVNKTMVSQLNATRSQRVNDASSSAQKASTSGWKNWFKPAA